MVLKKALLERKEYLATSRKHPVFFSNTNKVTVETENKFGRFNNIQVIETPVVLPMQKKICSMGLLHAGYESKEPPTQCTLIKKDYHIIAY